MNEDEAVEFLNKQTLEDRDEDSKIVKKMENGVR